MGLLILQNPYLCRNYYEHAKFDSVVQLQERLNEVEPTSMLNPDGFFGEQTQETVKRYQERKRIRVDGIVGPETLRCLNSEGLHNQNDSTLLNSNSHLLGNNSADFRYNENTGRYEPYISEYIDVPISKIGMSQSTNILFEGLDDSSKVLDKIGHANEIAVQFNNDWDEIKIIPKTLKDAIVKFSEKTLPPLYYRRMRNSILSKISFTKMNGWKRLPFFDVKTKRGTIEGVSTKIGNYIGGFTDIVNLVTLKYQWDEFQKKQKNGKASIQDYIDISLNVIGAFISILEGVIIGGKHLDKRGLLEKQCIQSLKGLIAEKGMFVTTTRALSRFLGIIGMGALALEIGCATGNFIRTIPIADHNIGYFIDVEIDEMFHHPYKWASKFGFLGGTIVIALLIDAYKKGVDIFTLLTYEMNELTYEINNNYDYTNPTNSAGFGWVLH